MPRQVRNFYVTGELTGHKKPLSAGPQGEDGEMFLRIWLKENGEVSNQHVEIVGRVVGDQLELEVNERPAPGSPRGQSFTLRTQR